MSATLAQLLLTRRPPWPEPTPEQRWAAFRERERLRWECLTEAERAAERLASLRWRVRYGCRRLRTGHEQRLLTPLATVRAETADALRRLGHPRLARAVERRPLPRPPAEQMELSLGA